MLYGLLPPFLSSMALSLIKLAKRNDIIHAHWSACGAVAILTQPIHRKPVVTTLRGSDIHKAKKLGPFSWLHNKSLKGSSFTIGVSQAITNELKRQNPDMTEKIKFVSDGADDVFYAVPRNRQSVSVSPFKLLFIGSLIPRKGLDVLLKALAISKTDFPWMLTVVGSGPEKGYLSSLAAILGIDANVHFLGNVSPAQIAELMGDHHLFILPSYLEGRPSVVHEAMAAAMPVLATDIDGTRELVTNSEAGWLVPPGAENALSIALDDIIKGKRDLKAAGLAGRKWMLEHELTWNNTAKQYNQLYEEAIQSFKRTKP
ncbi:MAG: hypothetical protein AVO38_09990 [delta proteobacterium ML8_D]|nr:MAG: hypothetical protein AVO38_09990 [delta proteobacterium ML8_D]